MSEKKENNHTEETSQNPDNKEHSPLVEAAENIEEGVKIVGEKVSEVAATIADKTSELAGPVIEQVRESVSDITDLGKKAVDEVTRTAQNYIETYKNKVEMNKIGEKRKQLVIKLGSIIYVRYKIRNIGPEKLFKHQEILRLIKDIEKIDKEIITLGKEMDKLNK
jgi:hypothetical protein